MVLFPKKTRVYLYIEIYNNKWQINGYGYNFTILFFVEDKAKKQQILISEIWR